MPEAAPSWTFARIIWSIGFEEIKEYEDGNIDAVLKL